MIFSIILVLENRKFRSLKVLEKCLNFVVGVCYEPCISIVDVPIILVQCVRNLGICIDAGMMMQTTTNSIALLRRPTSATTDQSTSTKGSLTVWLKQQCVNLRTSLSHTPISVSTECGYKAHQPAEVFWPHHWCTGLSPLAADTRAHRVQDRCVDLQSHEWYGTATMEPLKSVSPTCLADGFAFCSHKSSDSTSC